MVDLVAIFRLDRMIYWRIILLDFKKIQQQKIEEIIAKVKSDPAQYLSFESISDVYQAQWLAELPACCRWYVSGLDDGTGEFLLSICYADYQITFESHLS